LKASNGGLCGVQEGKESVIMVAKPQLTSMNRFEKLHVNADMEVNVARGA